MKPKETQVLGLYILGLISFIILAFAQVYSLVNYVKLTSLDSVTSFAVMDAVFYTIIKLLIVLYIVFYLGVDIRGQFIQRERLRNKILAKLKSEKLIIDNTNHIGRPIDANFNQFILEDLVKEFKLQDESSKLNFEPVKDGLICNSISEITQKYGFKGYMRLSNRLKVQLFSTILREKFEALKELSNYYNNRSNNEDDLKYWDTVQNELELIDIEFKS